MGLAAVIMGHKVVVHLYSVGIDTVRHVFVAFAFVEDSAYRGGKFLVGNGDKAGVSATETGEEGSRVPKVVADCTGLDRFSFDRVALG